MSTGKTKKPPILKIMFDTNVIYTGSSSDLLREDVSQLIREKSDHPDLVVHWCIPELVLKEREHQMIRRGLELLPSIQKLERLISHNLAINETLIRSSVKNVIEKQVNDLKLQLISLDVQKVNWPEVITHSVTRIAPFSPGEAEAGFRDRIILETFVQLADSSPMTPSICRLAIVTEDKLLISAANSILGSRANVRVLNSLEDLKSLINTLIAEVDEVFVAQIQDKAAKYFFEKEDTSTLYEREKLGARISSQFKSELSAHSENADDRENGTWYISKPRFVKKERQRITWASKIAVDAKSIKRGTPYLSAQAFSNLNYISSLDLGNLSTGSVVLSSRDLTTVPSGSVILDSSNLNSLSTANLVTRDPNTFSRFSFQADKVVSKGSTVFEVIWSISVSTTQKFSRPKIEEIKFVETVWEN